MTDQPLRRAVNPPRYGASTSALATQIGGLSGCAAVPVVVTDGALSATHDPPHQALCRGTNSASKGDAHRGPTQQMAEAPGVTRLREASDPGRLVQ